MHVCIICKLIESHHVYSRLHIDIKSQWFIVYFVSFRPRLQLLFSLWMPLQTETKRDMETYVIDVIDLKFGVRGCWRKFL